MAYYYPYYSYTFLYLVIFKLFKLKMLSEDPDSLPTLQYLGLPHNQHWEDLESKLKLQLITL